MNPVRRRAVNVLSALESLRCYLEGPRTCDRGRKPDDDQDNEQANDPVWDVEHRKDLRDSLRQRPTCNDVGNSDLVDVAPL